MTTEGIEGVFLETHNWGKAAKFWQALGYQLELETDHGSGLLRGAEGPYIFISEIPESRAPQIQPILKVLDSDALSLDPSIEVVRSFEDTHWGTQEMLVRDPDGRVWSLQAPVKK